MGAAQANRLDPEPFGVESGGLSLAGAEISPDAGAPSLILMHGLTATRRYVVHRSRTLPRRGFRLVAYDARGHGESDAAPPGSYEYEHLVADVGAVIEARVGAGRPVLVGHSMGAHTAAAYALAHPDRLAGAVFVGPAVTGVPPSEEVLDYWDRLADGLEQGGVKSFLGIYERDLNPEWRETVLRFTKERLEAHRHPRAVAQALREVPRSLPFEGIAELGFLELPALVAASHDEADPAHPFAVAEAWAESLPQGRLVSEEPGQSPLAWQGGRLSRAIAEFCEAEAVRERFGGTDGP